MSPLPSLALVLASALAAAPAAERGAPPPPPAPHGARLLWRVERAGRVSHLFGTAHLGFDLDAALGPRGREALEHATRVFVEIDLTPGPAAKDFAQSLMARSQLPPDRSLHALLGPQRWKRLTELNRGRVPPERLDRLKPWFAAMLTEYVLIARGRTAPPPGVLSGRVLDVAIAERAKARGIRVAGLESPLEHVAAFTAPEAEGIEMLDELLKSGEASQAELDELVDAYASGDDQRLRKAYGRLWRRKPLLAERLLFTRNERWCQHLDKWLPDGGMFVAVGMFHLLGDRGLVECLRRRGYRVARVRDGVR